MTDVIIPEGFHWERLSRSHQRKRFKSGVSEVDRWLQQQACQNQDKHLSSTKVLLDANADIAGFFTLATGQVDFSALPTELAARLPKRVLPVAVLAWLGVATEHQGQGLGRRLLAQALRDCYAAGQTFSFVAVIIDCLGDRAKAFYQKWDFAELPGNPYRLFLPASQLEAMMRSP